MNDDDAKERKTMKVVAWEKLLVEPHADQGGVT
jgi:hypothetical protein